MEKPLKKDFTRPFNNNTGLVLFDRNEYIKAIDKYVDKLEKQIKKLKAKS